MKGYSGLACDKSCSTYRSGTDCVATCPTGTFSDDYTMYCLGCPSNCQTCTAIDVCTECADHFNLRGGFCDPAYSWIMSLSLIVFLLSWYIFFADLMVPIIFWYIYFNLMQPQSK